MTTRITHAAADMPTEKPCNSGGQLIVTFADKCRILQQAEQDLRLTQNELSNLQAQKRACESLIERMRTAILEEMQADGVLSAEESGLVYSVKRTPVTAVVLDEALVPDDYWEIERKLDKAKLNKDIKEGVAVPGAVLGNGGVTLEVRGVK